MSAEEQYQKFADLVTYLRYLTSHDTLQWEDMGPLGFFQAEYQGVKYVFDNPQDGKPSLIVDAVCVWVGYELWDLRDTIHRQDSRLHPPKPLPAPPPPDPQIPEVLDRALETFKKK